MSILHTVNKPGQPVALCLRAVSSGDSVLLIEEAVYELMGRGLYPRIARFLSWELTQWREAYRCVLSLLIMSALWPYALSMIRYFHGFNIIQSYILLNISSNNSKQ